MSIQFKVAILIYIRFLLMQVLCHIMHYMSDRFKHILHEIHNTAQEQQEANENCVQINVAIIWWMLIGPSVLCYTYVLSFISCAIGLKPILHKVHNVA
jgi:hypothetical protein